MFHFVYITINLVNGKIYGGLHSTDNLEDGYKGSGTYLKKAFKKYGKNNFQVIKRIFFETRELAKEFEELLVSEIIEKLGRKGSYNRDYGGTGACKGEDNHFYGKSHTDATKKILSDNASKRVGELNPFYGKTHSEQTKKRISIANKGKDKFQLEHLMKRSLEKRVGWYVTPYGCFDTASVAAKYSFISKSAILLRCKNPDKVVKPNYQIPEKYWGKTWRQNGYYIIYFEQFGEINDLT